MRHYGTLINESILGMQYQRSSLLQIHKQELGKGSETFIEEIGRNNFRKNLAMALISGAAGRQYKLSLKLYLRRQGKNAGKEGTSTQTSWILHQNDSQNI